MKKKKNFTLVELSIVIILLGILATVAIPGFLNLAERARADTCFLNLETLLGAIETFAIENNVLPATLGKLPNEYIERSWARVQEQNNSWRINFIYFIKNLRKGNLAFAQNIPEYLAEAIALRCPSDDNPATPSYRLAPGVKGITFAQYRSLSAATIIVEETAARHKNYRIGSVSNYRQGVRKGGKPSWAPGPPPWAPGPPDGTPGVGQ